jgi:hypothetical protein
MAKEQQPSDQFSGIAEQAMEQARRAADTYFDYVKQAISVTPSGGNEFAERIKGYAEKNITMTQEYLRQLSQARNFQDMVRIGSHPSRFHAVADESVWRTKLGGSTQSRSGYR